jgi:hypothetical protein
MWWRSARSAVVRLATAATLMLSCTLEPAPQPAVETGGPASGSGTGEAGGGSSSPILVDVDANQVMKADAGSGVGVFTEYRTGGHWHVWWTCDTAVDQDSACNYDISVSAESGGIANAVTEGPDAASVSWGGSNSIDLVVTTTIAVDGVAFDTDPGAIITLDAMLNGEQNGAFLFFVQRGKINGGYQGTLSDPLMLEPAPGGA